MTLSNEHRPGWAFIVPESAVISGLVEHFIIPLCRQFTLNSKFYPYLIILSDQANSTEIKVVDDYYTEIRINLPTPVIESKNSLFTLFNYQLQRKTCFRYLNELFTQYRIRVINPYGLLFQYLVFYDFCVQHDNDYALIYSMYTANPAKWDNVGLFHSRLWQKLVAGADYIVAGNQSLLTFLDQLPATVKYTAKIIKAGIDPMYFVDDEKTTEKTARVDQNTILSIGNNEIEHLSVILNAFARVNRLKPELKLAMIINAQDCLELLDDLANRLGITSKIELLLAINLDNFKAYYMKTLVYVDPGSGDALSMSLLEAGAMGLPVLCDKSSAAAEIIQQRQTGILLDMENAGELADEIYNLCNDAVQRRLLGAKLKAYVREHHRWENTACAYLDLVTDRAN